MQAAKTWDVYNGQFGAPNIPAAPLEWRSGSSEQMESTQKVAKPSEGACLQDEEVPENEVCEAAGDDVDQRQDKAPDHKDAPGLRQLQQVCDLKACDVIHAEEQYERLRAPWQPSAHVYKTAVPMHHRAFAKGKSFWRCIQLLCSGVSKLQQRCWERAGSARSPGLLQED